MKRYGIWNVVLIEANGGVVKDQIVATSGKDVKVRTERRYPGSEVLKMKRKKWMNGFNREYMTTVLNDNFVDEDAIIFLEILSDAGIFENPDDETDCGALYDI